MSGFFEKVWLFFRARWRWAHSRCPRCDRNLIAAFPNYPADYPDCPNCKDETGPALRVWHRYAASGAVRGAGVTAAASAVGIHPPDQKRLDLEQARADEDRWNDDGGQG